MGKTNEEKVLQNIEFNRFGLISAILLVVGCLGGLTVGMGAVNAIWSLTLVVVPTMATLALLLAVAPMRYVFTAGIIATIIDIILLIYLLAI